jgi:hypothetical protein
MSNKKQTAVEWLVSELRKYGSPVPRQYEYQAKEMEKQQIIDAVSKGWDNYEDGKVRWIGEQYYNENYEI